MYSQPWVPAPGRGSDYILTDSHYSTAKTASLSPNRIKPLIRDRNWWALVLPQREWALVTHITTGKVIDMGIKTKIWDRPWLLLLLIMVALQSGRSPDY